VWKAQEADVGNRPVLAAPLAAEEAERFLHLAERLFGKMIEQQRAKVLRLAREAVPNIGPEDVLNPHDFPQLKAHPTFEYEDGILAGLLSAWIAVRAEIKQSAPDPDNPAG
jgi:hypothetical protein